MLGRSLLLVALATGLAAAQPKEPTKAQKEKITELTKHAIDRSKNGDHEGAIKDLKEAYDIAPDAAAVLLSNIGYEYKHLKNSEEAWKYFCMYLDKEPGGSASSYVLTEAKQLHAELKYEGEVCSKQPEKVTPPPPDPKPDPEPKKSPAAPVKPKPAGRNMKLAGIGMAGAGAVAPGASVFFGLKAKTARDKINEGPPIDAAGVQLGWGPHPEEGWDGIKQYESDLSSNKKLSIVTGIVGGALIGGGVFLYVKGRGKASETTIVPNAGPGSAGVTLSGSF